MLFFSLRLNIFLNCDFSFCFFCFFLLFFSFLFFFFFFFLMIRRPPRSTLFPYRRSSDLCPCLSKGNRVNIPEPGRGDWPLGAQCGNANERGDVGGSPGKSSLFFVRSGLPGIGLPGDRDVASVKLRASRGVRCTAVGP